MNLSPEKEKTIRHQFDAYCKKVLKGELFSYRREIASKTKKEIVFSDLSESQLLRLSDMSCEDEYSTEFFRIHIMGEDVFIRSESLMNALSELSDLQRDIIFLAYFLDLPDRIIAEELGMQWYKIQYRRTCSLKRMRDILERNE